MTKHEWSKKKLAVAEAMAEGTRTQGDIAKEFNIKDAQISRWKREPEFIQKIDEITMALERHTLAGMLRRIDKQQKDTTVRSDEWLKIEEFRAKLLGFDKQKIEHIGNMNISHTISDDPQVLAAANELARRIAKTKK